MGSSKETQNSSAPVAEAGQESSEGIERGNWGGQLEFILTCVGYAVGLGNVWRFPYLAFRNGGGAFLVPYIIMLAFVGLPVFHFELAFGQFASLGPASIWTVSPLLKGVGCGSISVSLLIALYYNVIIAWSFFYLFSSFTGDLPFASCGNSWNNFRCITGSELRELNTNETLRNETLAGLNFSSVREFQSPSEQFYYNNVLHRSDSIDDFGAPVWQLVLCLLLCYMIVFLVLIKGINSLGKVVYVVAIFPYIMMTILIVRGATLEGAGTGVEFYLKPDPAQLQQASVWSDAATQIFFSLSACSGGLVAMASYNKFHNNCYRDSILVPIINCCTSVYAGFAIFSILGYLAQEKGVAVADVAESGPGLVFVVYPEALTLMPVPTLWSILFFVMLIMLGFSSQFSICEAVFITIIDEFPDILRKNAIRPIIFRGVMCCIFFLITIPMVCNGGFYLFNLVDAAMSGFPLLIIGFMEVSSVMYVYGWDNFAEDVSMMIGKRPNIYFQVCWRFITPLLLIVILIFLAVEFVPVNEDGVPYPDWAQALYWLVTSFVIAWIPGVFIYRMCVNGAWQVIKDSAKPSPLWGPALPENRTGKYSAVLWDPQHSSPSSKGMSRTPSYVNMQNGSDNGLTAMYDFKNGTTNPAFANGDLKY